MAKQGRKKKVKKDVATVGDLYEIKKKPLEPMDEDQTVITVIKKDVS